jgi:integrase/recombinase XerC
MEQIRDLLLLCDENRFLGTRNKAIVLTLLDTGLRLTELANIQLANVDFDRETIKVMGKGAKERVVRIGKKTQKAILRYLLMRKDDHPCLWVTEERRPLRAFGVQTMIKRLGRRAGISSVRCSAHTFRHTFATRALLNGAGEFEVQSLLGHEGLDMTRRYAASLRSEAAVAGHRRFSPVDNMKL